MSQFAGKTAIISGGAEGIGLSIAKALGEQKMNIVLGDIDQKNLEKASLELRDSGISVLPVTLDVADENNHRLKIEQVVAISIQFLTENLSIILPTKSRAIKFPQK